MSDQDLIYKIVGEKVTNIKKIPFGVSNVNFLVNDKFVVRIKKEKEHFYSYRHEKEILHKTSTLYLSEIVKYLDKDGNKVSEYIQNSHIYSGKNDEIIMAAKMLKKLHQSPVKTRIKFKPFKRYSYYKNNSNGDFFPHEDAVLKATHKLYRKYNLVICHNDVVDNNLLYTKNKSYLIDYEFAGKNIFLFDLASFISENNIKNEKKIKLFLNTYDFPLTNIRELNIMIMFLNLLWYYWSLERFNKTKLNIYQTIANVKKRNIKDDINHINKTKFF
ncbi:MAG: phosphotransferase [Bacilli bacterium]|nr:phosphotransferase [Bacilli bacterium]